MEVQENRSTEGPTYKETRRQRSARLRRDRANQKNQRKMAAKGKKAEGVRPEDGPTPHHRHKAATVSRERSDKRLELTGFFQDGIGKSKKMRTKQLETEEVVLIHPDEYYLTDTDRVLVSRLESEGFAVGICPKVIISGCHDKLHPNPEMVIDLLDDGPDRVPFMSPEEQQELQFASR